MGDNSVLLAYDTASPGNGIRTLSRTSLYLEDEGNVLLQRGGIRLGPDAAPHHSKAGCSYFIRPENKQQVNFKAKQMQNAKSAFRMFPSIFVTG